MPGNDSSNQHSPLCPKASLGLCSTNSQTQLNRRQQLEELEQNHFEVHKGILIHVITQQNITAIVGVNGRVYQVIQPISKSLLQEGHNYSTKVLV